MFILILLRELVRCSRYRNWIVMDLLRIGIRFHKELFNLIQLIQTMRFIIRSLQVLPMLASKGHLSLSVVVIFWERMFRMLGLLRFRFMIRVVFICSRPVSMIEASWLLRLNLGPWWLALRICRLTCIFRKIHFLEKRSCCLYLLSTDQVIWVKRLLMIYWGS